MPFRYVVLAWTLCACLWCVQTAVVEASRPGRRVGRAPMGYVIQFACAAVWIAFTPGVLWAARRLRVAGPRWGRALAAHVALGAAMAVVQQWLTNALVGDVRLRLSSLDVLPLSLNGFVYLALVAWVQARAFAAASRERALAADRLAADLERVRLRSLALELRPAFVSAVLVGGAELAVRDPARAERVVEQLADLLRAVLDEAAAERPPTVREELALVAAALALLEQLAGRPVRLDDAVPPALRDAPVAAGALRRVLDLAAARAADPGAAAVDVRVAPAVGAPGAGEAGVPSLVAHVRTTPAAHAASA